VLLEVERQMTKLTEFGRTAFVLILAWIALLRQHFELFIWVLHEARDGFYHTDFLSSAFILNTDYLGTSLYYYYIWILCSSESGLSYAYFS
jgi:hypothetical protein